jgi:anti-sigma factor RsiW
MLDLWLGELSEDEAGAVEEHVFSCETCGVHFDRVASMAADVESLASRCPPATLTREQVARLSQRGVRVLEVPFPAFGRLPFGAMPEDIDVVVSVIALDLADVRSIDLAIYNQHGGEPVRVPAVAFEARDAAVLVACGRHVAAANTAFRVTLEAEMTSGERRLVADTGIVPREV